MLLVGFGAIGGFSSQPVSDDTSTGRTHSTGRGITSTGELCSRTRFGLAEILVLIASAILPAPAVPVLGSLLR